MDYSIGSLSDLITGSITPNKPKVVKKHVILENKSTNVVPRNETLNVKNVVPARKNKVKRSKHVTTDPTVKKTKKRKLPNTEEGPPEPKRSKFSENAERRVVTKNRVKNEEDPEILARTVFVGNLPVTLGPKRLKKMFKKYGIIESTRIRGISVANPKVSKKVAVIKKELHPDRKSFNGYVRFEKREDAIKATEMNNTIYNEHHLRVRLCDAKDRPDESKAIFIGNLSFYAEEDDLWKLFEPCGPLESVRIIRDIKTGIGKGFGYVNFKNSDSVTLALEMENVKLRDRELRISICNINAAKKKSRNNKTKITKPGKPKGFKGQKREKKVHEEVHAEKSQEDTELLLKKKANRFKEDGTKINAEQGFKNKSFQGAKFAYKKKKSKLNKGLLQKKKMIEKVAPK